MFRIRLFALMVAAARVIHFAQAAESASTRAGEATPVGNSAPLTERGLANVTAFTRLLGFVRYFHPSDEAAATDWDAFGIGGMREVEKAASPEECVSILQQLFERIAPTVRVVAQGPANVVAPPDLSGLRATHLMRWQHVGLRHSAPSIYHSQRERVPLDAKGTPGDFAAGVLFRAQLAPGVACVVPLAVFAYGR